MSEWNISQEAINELKKLSSELMECRDLYTSCVSILSDTVDEYSDGLGLHVSTIRNLIDELKTDCDKSGIQLSKLSIKLTKAAVIRDASLTNDPYKGVSGQNKYSSETIPNRTKKGFDSLGYSSNEGVRDGQNLYEIPRDLPVTQQEFKKDLDGNDIYNSPLETADSLCPKQGKARFGFGGTCGLCSVANLLRLAGVDISEGDIIDFASKTNAPNSSSKLCETGHLLPGQNGGTSADDRKEILSHFGIESGVFDIETDKNGNPTRSNIENIAKYVSEGRGVIISIHAYSLWRDDPRPVNDYHAITVTSVKRSPSGEILGFYVHDTGIGGTHYYSASKIQESLSGAPMNVTYQILR